MSHSFLDEIVPLGETGDYINGIGFKESDWDGAGLPIIRIQNLTNEEKPFNRTSREVDEKYHVKNGDILVSWSATLDAFVWRRGPALLNQHIFKVIPRQDSIDPRFLYYQLKAIIYSMSRGEHAHGSTLKHINRKPFLAHPFWRPCLEKQEEIGQWLDAQFSGLDETERTLQAIQAKIKQARASILKAAVEGRLVKTQQQPPLARSSDQSNQSDRTSEKTSPNGWDIHQARAVCTSIESGTTPSKEHLSDLAEGNVPFIKVYNLTVTGRLEFQDNRPTYVTAEYHATKMKRSRTLPADVLTNIVGPPLGKVSIVPSESEEWNINQAIARFRCGPTLLPKFLSIYLQSHQAQSWLASTSKTTTSQVNISISKCRILPVPVPPISEQQNIVAEVERRFSVLDQVEATANTSLSRCGQLRQAVLRRAFGG